MKKTLIRILYFEDDPMEVDLAKLALQRACPEIETEFHVVTDGLEAMRFLDMKERSGQRVPDIIVTDLHLPKIDGIDLIRKVKAMPFFRDVPIVVLTGTVSPTEKERLRALDVTEILMKPFSLEGYNDIFRGICSTLVGQRPS